MRSENVSNTLDFDTLFRQFLKIRISEFESVAEPFVAEHFIGNARICGSALIDNSLISAEASRNPGTVIEILLHELKKIYLGAALTKLFPHILLNLKIYSPVFPPDGVSVEPDGKSSPESGVGGSIMPGIAQFLPFFIFMIDVGKASIMERLASDSSASEEFLSHIHAFIRSGLLTYFNEGCIRAEVLFHAYRLPKRLDAMFAWYIRSATDEIIRKQTFDPAPNLPSIIQCRLKDPRPEIRSLASEAQDKLKAFVDFNKACICIHFGSNAAIRNLLVDKKNARALVDIGIMRGQNNCFGEALMFCSDALRIDPQDAQAARNVGHAFVRSGWYDAAIPYLEQAMASDTPWSALALTSLITAELVQNKTEEVERRIQELLGKRDQVPDEYRRSAYYYFIDPLIELGRIDESKSCLVECEKVVNPTPAFCLELLVARLHLCSAENDQAGMIRLFNQLPEIDNIDLPAQRQIMQYLRVAGMKTELEQFTQAVKEKNSIASLTGWLAVFHPIMLEFMRCIMDRQNTLFRQIIGILWGDYHDSLEFHMRMAHRMLQDEELRLIVNQCSSPDSRSYSDRVGRIFAGVAQHVLVAGNFHYPQLEEVFAVSLEIAVGDLEPWPPNGKCTCGKVLRDYVFCNCGYRFEELPGDFFYCLPTSLHLTCTRCGEKFIGFTCDACGKSFSWLRSRYF